MNIESRIIEVQQDILENHKELLLLMGVVYVENLRVAHPTYNEGQLIELLSEAIFAEFRKLKHFHSSEVIRERVESGIRKVFVHNRLMRQS